MPANPQRKAESRRRILEEAGRLFRRHGYEGVGIDAIMQAAGLTRGAFYAHFPSKRDLFAEVIGGEHGFNRLMKARTGGSDKELLTEAIGIVGDYLHPDHRAEVGLGCIMAALSADVGRADAATRRAYAARVRELVEEFGRGLRAPESDLDPRALAAMVMSVGALIMVRAMDDEDLARRTLAACRKEAERLLKSKPA